MNNDKADLSLREKEFLRRADSDGRVFSDRSDGGVIDSLKRKGLIEQNVYWGSCYWVKKGPNW